MRADMSKVLVEEPDTGAPRHVPSWARGEAGASGRTVTARAHLHASA
jgi:hypothetical protein